MYKLKKYIFLEKKSLNWTKTGIGHLGHENWSKNTDFRRYLLNLDYLNIDSL